MIITGELEFIIDSKKFTVRDMDLTKISPGKYAILSCICSVFFFGSVRGDMNYHEIYEVFNEEL